MSDKNESIDKLADEYSNSDTDQKAYIKAQTSTIISQTKEMNGLKREIERLAKENERLVLENIQMRALAPSSSDSQFNTTDEETICIIQMAMLKNMAMTRELTMEECKKSEIYLKMLQSIRGKVIIKEEEKMDKLSNEDLLKLMDNFGKDQ